MHGSAVIGWSSHVDTIAWFVNMLSKPPEVFFASILVGSSYSLRVEPAQGWVEVAQKFDL